MCCNNTGSKCTIDYTNRINKVKIDINTLLKVTTGKTNYDLRGVLSELDTTTECPSKSLFNSIKNYVDNEYSEHFK